MSQRRGISNLPSWMTKDGGQGKPAKERARNDNNNNNDDNNASGDTKALQVIQLIKGRVEKVL
jgi:hypothetical protein